MYTVKKRFCKVRRPGADRACAMMIRKVDFVSAKCHHPLENCASFFLKLASAPADNGVASLIACAGTKPI